MSEIEQAGYDSSFYTTPEWFNSLAWQHQWIEKMAGWWVGEFGCPKTVIDLGAGDGWWCKAFNDMGANCWAVELDEIAKKFIPPQIQFIQHDLREAAEIQGHYDLVICLEVAEHLPKDSAETLTQTIVQATGKHCLFSAAPPGQAGTGHVNLQPLSYWRGLIEPYGLQLDSPRTGKTRDAFTNIVNNCFEFLPKNIQVFTRVQ